MGYIKGNQSNILNDFKIKIEGRDITQSQLISLTIKWSMEDMKVLGNMVFIDETSLVERIPIRGGNKVKIELEDSEGKSMSQEMDIVSVSYTRAQSQSNVVTLMLMDSTSTTALNSFKGIGWSNVNMEGIVNSLITPLAKNKTPSFGIPTEPLKDFIIPLNMSLYKLTTWLKDNLNLFVFQTRDSLVTKSLGEIFDKSSDTEEYVYKPNNQGYRRAIYEYSTNYGNKVEENSLQGDSKMFSFDPLNKGLKETSQSFSNVVDNFSKGLPAIKAPSIGSKYYYMSDQIVKKASESLIAKNAYKNVKLELLVAGRFSVNVGDNIKVNLASLITEKDPEPNISGDWLVSEITDIINPPDFIQRMVLTRANFAT